MNITKKNSPNKYDGRKGWKPDMIVCHITEGAYAGAVSWLCNPDAQASAHFVVAKDGRISQLVELTDGSWCNGTSTDPASSVFYGKSSLAAVRERKTNANYYTVSIEHEGMWADAHGRLTDAQLAATIELIKYIRSEVKRLYGVDIPVDREHIVGHYQVDPITKPNCPGANFQFDEIIAALKGTMVTPSQPSNNAGSFNVGDTVKITGSNYATGQSIPGWVKNATHVISQFNGDKSQALLGANGGICSWVNIGDISKVGGSNSTPTPAPDPTPAASSDEINVGDTVKITGSNYATGQAIPQWVKNGTHVVSEISGDRVLLGANGGICSWVYKNDVQLASGGAAAKPAPSVRVGCHVKITGSQYATGQNIPQWVKNQEHVVSQFNGNKTQVLLGANGGICSWVNTSDVYAVD